MTVRIVENCGKALDVTVHACSYTPDNPDRKHYLMQKVVHSDGSPVLGPDGKQLRVCRTWWPSRGETAPRGAAILTEREASV